MSELNVSSSGRKRIVLAVLTCFAAFMVASNIFMAPAMAADTISGTTTRITTDLAAQFDPAISGDIIVYTDLRNGNGDIYYYNITSGTETRATIATADEQLNDVSGNTIVYTEFGGSTGGGDIKAFNILTRVTSTVAADPTSAQGNPAIGGSIVAWEDGRDGNVEIYAKDLSSGVEKRLTVSPTATDYEPAVSGGRVAHTAIEGTQAQIFVTDFATLATKQLTTAGLHRYPDISGNIVVYQGKRADGDQDIFVYNLATSTETRISLPGVQRNPNVCGDWVSFEDLSAGNSDIRLYHIPTGTIFTAAATSSNEYLNDIDSNRIAYTVDEGGNLDIYLFTFIPDITPPTTTISSSDTLGSNGWYTSDVYVLLTATDDRSGVANTYYRIDGGTWLTYLDPFWITSEGIHTLEYYSVDYVDNTETIKSETIKIDKTLPTTAISVSGVAGLNDWWTSDVTVTLTATDTHSGIANTYYRIDGASWSAYTSSFSITTEGIHTVEYYSVDNAGHDETSIWAPPSPNSETIRIDKTPPDLIITEPTPGDYYNFEYINIAHITSDPISGIAQITEALDGTILTVDEPIDLSTLSLGTHTITVTATDVAGNTAIQQVTFNVIQISTDIDVTKTLNRYTRNDIGQGRLVSKTTVVNTGAPIIKIEDSEQFPNSFTLQTIAGVTIFDPSNPAYKYKIPPTAYTVQYITGGVNVTVTFPLAATLTYYDTSTGQWITQSVTLDNLPTNWVIQFQYILAPPSTLTPGTYTTTATVTAWTTPTNYTIEIATATLTIEEKKNP